MKKITTSQSFFKKNLAVFLLLFLVGIQSFLALSLISFAINPSAALAQAPAPSPAPAAEPASKQGESTNSFNVNKYLTAPGQDQKYLKSKNPIASAVIQVINLMVLTIGSVSFLAIVVGGFTYVISHGNENLVNKAKEMITYAIMGLVIALAAYFIVAFFQTLFYEL